MRQTAFIPGPALAITTAPQLRIEHKEGVIHDLPFDKIGLPLTNSVKIVGLNQIVYFEADSNYTIVHLLNKKKIVVSKPLKWFETLLVMQPQYLRIHRSYMINLNFLQGFVRGKTGYVEMTNDAQLDVGSSYRSQLIEVLTRYFGVSPSE